METEGRILDPEHPAVKFYVQEVSRRVYWRRCISMGQVPYRPMWEDKSIVWI
jgi:hypothetical protein